MALGNFLVSDHPAVVLLEVLSGIATLILFFAPRMKFQDRTVLLVVAIALVVYATRKEPADESPGGKKPTIEETRRQFNEAFTLASRGSYVGALDIYNTISKYEPDYPTLDSQRSFCLRSIGDFAEALAAARAAWNKLSNTTAGRQDFAQLGAAEYNLAILELLNGDVGAARDALGKAALHGFPHGCAVLQDPDLQVLKSEPSLAPLVREFELKTWKTCSTS
ncbi:MAG TPA: hypothetical protein VGN17_01880 [Bryobacteraceae bacterium]|jgi:tetratricopeptide (TPR) repeat protein